MTLIKVRGQVEACENFFPRPRYIRAKNEKNCIVFKGNDNAAAAVGPTRAKTNKRPFQGTLNYNYKFCDF